MTARFGATASVNAQNCFLVMHAFFSIPSMLGFWAESACYQSMFVESQHRLDTAKQVNLSIFQATDV